MMGNLYYLIGPSGSGKDSIMDYARQRIPEEAKVVFAHRYITRPRSAGGENHVALSETEFLARKRGGLFCMSWGSHGLRYGIGVEVNAWRELGYSVVVNGSRDYLGQAKLRMPGLVPILVSVSRETLRSRLKARGRETDQQIEERLARIVDLDAEAFGVLQLSNDGALEDAGERFLDMVLGSVPAKG